MMFVISCKNDPCESVTCLNGGTCNNGSCDYPQGFTGPDCSQIDFPNKIKIVSIKLLDFPPLSVYTNQPYDSLDGPDIISQISWPTTSTLWYNLDTIFNAIPNTEYTFNCGVEFNPNNINNLNDSLIIIFHDFDGEMFDLMWGKKFSIYDNSANSNRVDTIIDNGFKVVVTINNTW